VQSADERGKLAQIRAVRCLEGDPGPDSVAFLGRLIICRLYKLTLLVQTQVTLQLMVRLTNLV